MGKMSRMRMVQQAHLSCLVPELAAVVDITLSLGIPIQRKNVGNRVIKQQCGK